MTRKYKEYDTKSTLPLVRNADGKFEIQKIAEFDFEKSKLHAKKAHAALELSYKISLSNSKQFGISAKELRKVLGNKSNSKIAEYLHSLFAQCGSYSLQSKDTYEYVPVDSRIERLERQLKVTDGLLDYAESIGKSFRVCPKLDEYKFVKDRHYAWFVNINKDVRKKLFIATHGVMYDYDMAAAKPTIILQAWNEWMQINFPQELKKAQCKLPFWTDMVKNKVAFRKKMADDVGISVKQVKLVCQSVTNSGWASPHAGNTICDMLGVDATKRLMENSQYKGLRKDYGVMWDFFKQSNDAGQTPGQYLSAFYTKHECEIMKVVFRVLKQDAWFVHDGFMTHTQVNTKLLEEEVLAGTGFKVKFDEEIFSGPEAEVGVEDGQVEAEAEVGVGLGSYNDVQNRKNVVPYTVAAERLANRRQTGQFYMCSFGTSREQCAS